PARAAVEELDRVAPALVLRLLQVALREVAVVDGPDAPAGDLLHVGAPADPRGAQRRKPDGRVGVERGVAPWPRCVVDADGLVRGLGAARKAGGGQGDLAHRDAHAGAAA